MNQNQLKKLASLAHSKFRKSYGLFIAEGVHLTLEAARSDWEIQAIIATHEADLARAFPALAKTILRKQITVEPVSQREFSKLSATKSPQGVMAVVKIPESDLKGMTNHSRILIADGVSDPGNLGTMIRTAAAFEFEIIITTPGSADIFNPKTVRATQGALFQMKAASHVGAHEIAAQIRPAHKIYALSAQGRVDIADFHPAARSALIVGAEISGISREFLDSADQVLRIPISERIESLNAAAAAAIAMQRFYGQR
jgi:TrmH family RNA methyltransferase